MYTIYYSKKRWPAKRLEKLVRLYASGKTWAECQFAFETSGQTLRSLYYGTAQAHAIRKRLKVPSQHGRGRLFWTDARLNELITLHRVQRKTYKECSQILGRSAYALAAACMSPRASEIRRKRNITARQRTVVIGKRFGRLKVLRRVESREQKWRCVCTCGKTTEVFSTNLIRGKAASCGSHRPTGENAPSYKTGYWTKQNRPTMSSFASMHRRCNNEMCGGYENYGGRGIKVCERWSGPAGFGNFLADMGRRAKNRSLDRINVNGNYEPSNCRWATNKQQANNKQCHVKVEDVMKGGFEVYDDAAQNPF